MNPKEVNYTYETLLLLLKKEMHQRELAKELQTSLTRVQAVLKKLRDINVVDYKEAGKNHVYFIKKNLVSKSFILNAENYKFAKLLRAHPILEPILQEIIDKCPIKMIVLFGSYAKFIPKNESDIDIYLDTTDIKIKDKLKSINDNLSIQIRDFDTKDLLIREIIKNHILIRGGEEYYEKLEFFK